MSDLQSGTYIVFSKSTNQPIGRALAEDKSLGPKRVVNLPGGVEAPKWTLQKLDDGRYHLLIGGAPTTVIDKKIFALLTDKEKAQAWSLNRHPQHGENVFTIEDGEEGGWTLPGNEDDTQITFQGVRSTKSLPPQYFPDQLWVVTAKE